MKKLCCTILAFFATAIYLNAKDVGAVYSLDTGKVTWLSESASQTAKN